MMCVTPAADRRSLKVANLCLMYSYEKFVRRSAICSVLVCQILRKVIMCAPNASMQRDLPKNHLDLMIFRHERDSYRRDA
jgi:hypothetical protein